jgi:glycosyltransferase domain-containing protein
VSPVISVGLVTYNRAALLPRAIESVLKQSFTNYELLISDDNSTDDTTEVVNKFLGDKRVRYIRRKGIGMTQNFVETLRDAEGEYFLWLCDDDFIADNYLEVCFDFLSRHAAYALACGETRFVNGEQVLERTEKLYLEQTDGVDRLCHYFRNVNSNIILYGLMRRKEIIDLIYPDTFGADLLWSAQVIFLGKIKCLPETNFYYSVSGISNNTAQLKEYYHTTRQKPVNPYVVLRKELVKLILRPETVFHQRSSLAKATLIFRLWFILRERFTMSPYEAKLRGMLKVRTRFKALFK